MIVKVLFLLAFLTVVSCARNSLTFVIDDTGSMGDKIKHVKNAAKSIIDIVLNKKSTQIEDIVLVTFNDPVVKFRIRSRNETELKQAVNSIHARGGGLCPEPALSGIKRALEESKSGSYLFVFTDASAKDHHRFEEIKTLAQEKQCQIVFVLNAYCPNTSLQSESNQVYHKIAAATNGQVFRLPTYILRQVLDYVKETIKGDRTVITSSIVPTNLTFWTDIQFKIDDQIEYAVVSVSGVNVSLEIRDQRGRLMKASYYIINARNVQVVKLTNIFPGTYTAKVKGHIEVNIMVFGRTDFTFEHGFSTKFKSSLANTETQPTTGVKTLLMVSVKNPQTDALRQAVVQYVELLDMKDRVIRKLKSFKTNQWNKDFYCTESFLPPEEMFKIAVIAKAANTGRTIRRIAKTPVTPKARPEFEITPAVINKNEGEPVTIECNLRKGNPSPKVAWQFRPRDGTTSQWRYDGEVLNISSVQVDQAGEYFCSAENSEGRCNKTTTLIVQAKPVITIPKPIVTAMENTTAILQCKVVGGFPKPTITWYYKGPDSKAVIIMDNYEVVRIANIQLNNAGTYKCVARNTLRSVKGKVEVVVNAPPRIVTKTTEYNGVEGDVVMKLPCAAVGHPTPTITWVVDKQVVGNDQSKALYVKENALFLRNPLEEDSSDNSHTYMCYARNKFGKAVHPYNVSITKYPENDTDRNEIYGRHKQPFNLNCPLPYTDPNSIRWYKDADLLDKTGPTLHFDNPTERDNGNYTCRVSDLTGAVSHTVELVFGYPPTRDRNRLNFTIQWQGGNASLDCTPDEAAPTGEYKWYYNRKIVKGAHTPSLEVTAWGRYACKVTNPFGSLMVKYKVTSKDCAIPTSLLKTKHIPLILDSSSSWPAVTHTEKYIMVPHSEKLNLICQDNAPDTKTRSSQNSFIKFQDKRSIVATCDHEEAFLVDGVPRKFSELDCKDTVEYSIVKKEKTCLGDNTQLMHVGFHVNGFTEVYESCVDVVKNVPLYTKMNTVPLEKEPIGNNVKAKKSCLDECCYEKIQLVNAEDVSFGPAERSTYIDSLNSVNYCKPKYNTNWHDLEVITRTKTRFTVWSGAAKYKKVDAIWIPKYLWKVLKELDTSDTIAVIHVNEQTLGDRLCTGDCGESSWWFDPQGDRTYCCSLEDFKEALELAIDFDEE